MNHNDALYYTENMILRKEYFGGIVFLISSARYFEVNESAYKLLKALGPAPISKKEFERICDWANEQDVKNFIFECINQGILTSKDSSFGIRVIENEQLGTYISAPVETYLYLTHTCNQKCSFCYYNKSEHKDTMSFEDWCAIVDQLEQLGVCSLGFLGGEPLMKKKLLIALLDYSDKKMWRTITTNGTADGGIDADFAKRLAQYSSLEVNISIESDNHSIHDRIVGLSGALEIAMFSLKNLIEQNVIVTVKTVATQANYGSIYDLAKKVKEMGARGFYIMDYMPSYGQDYEKFKEISVPNKDYWSLITKCESLEDDHFYVLANTKYRFLAMEKKLDGQEKPLRYHTSKCSAGSINLDIMPNGDIYSCPITNGNKRYCLGNIRNKTICEIWNSDGLNVFRNRDPGNLINPQCKQCSNSTSCIGGCPISAEIFTGSTYGGDKRCPYASINE